MIKCSALNKIAIRKYLAAILFEGVANKQAANESFDINEFIKEFYFKIESAFCRK